MATLIQIQDETWKELMSRKEKGESFDDVIQKVLNESSKIKRDEKDDKKDNE